MDLLQSVVVYDGLPISSGASHGLGRISFRDAFQSWQAFLDTRTRAGPVTALFEFPETPGLRVPGRVVRLIESTFGQRSMRLLNRVLGQPPDGIDVPPSRYEEALELLSSLEPLPVNEWGMAPVWLWFTADFELLKSDGLRVWPGQDAEQFGNFQTPGGIVLGKSSTRLILQAKRSMGLTLSVPNASDDEIRELVPWLEGGLPMRLSSKHWTRWTLAKNGRSYRGKKIDPRG